jgi:hypothetical protein
MARTKLELNPEKKATMIRLLAEAIDKNTKDEHEVYEFIHALEDGFGFLSDQRWGLDSNTLAITRYIEDDLKKSAWLKSFQEMSEIASGAMIVANQSWEGIQVILSMDEELKAISETYGG